MAFVVVEGSFCSHAPMLTRVHHGTQPQFTHSGLTYVHMGTLLSRLKDSCGKRQMNKAAIAKACGVSRTAVTKWFKGGDIKAKHIFRIADLCGVRPRWLALGEGPREPLKAVQRLSEGAVELAQMYDALPVQVQENVMDLVLTLTHPKLPKDAA